MFNIAQKFDNVKFVIRRILDNSNELAEAILRKHGGYLTIPTTELVTSKEMSRFYGVETDYLRTVLNNHGITAKHEPDHVVRVSPDMLSMKFPALKVQESPDGVYCRISGFENGKVRDYYLPKNGVTVLYDPAAFLAVAPAILRGRKTNKRVAAEVWEDVLQCTEYMACPLFFGMERQEETPVLQLPAPTEAAPMNAIVNGVTFNVAPEVLSTLVRTAVSEAVDAVWSKFFKTTSPTAFK